MNKNKLTIWNYISIWWIITSFIIALVSWIISYKSSYEVTSINNNLNSKLLKNNEIETRKFQIKYDLYIEILNILSEWQKNNENDWYLKKAENLNSKLKKLGYKIRILAPKKVLNTYNCLLSNIWDYIYFVTKESPAHTYTEYWRSVIPWIYSLENEIRKDIWLEDKLPILEINESLEWDLSIYNSICWNEIMLDYYR